MEVANALVGAILLLIGVFVVLHYQVHLRVAALLFCILSGVISLLGGSGVLAGLVLIFFLRDIRVILRAWSPGGLWWCLLTIVGIYMIEPGPYAAAVGAGVLVAIYAVASLRSGGLVFVAWGGFLGAFVFAVRNLTAPVITVADQIGGDITLIGRRILPGLDPNAAAAILLVGMACGVFLSIHYGRFGNLVATLGLGLMTASIVLMAARFAMVAAVITLWLLWASKGNVPRKLLTAAGALLGVSLLLPLVREGASLARFAKLSADADSRVAIYNHWWRIVAEHGLALGVSPETIAAEPVGPHNAILEALVHFGLLGLLMLTVAAALLLQPFSNGGWQVRVPALAVLGLGMIVGLLGQYTIWIALVLLNAEGLHRKVVNGGFAERRRRRRLLVPPSAES